MKNRKSSLRNIVVWHAAGVVSKKKKKCAHKGRYYHVDNTCYIYLLDKNMALLYKAVSWSFEFTVSRKEKSSKASQLYFGTRKLTAVNRFSFLCCIGVLLYSVKNKVVKKPRIFLLYFQNRQWQRLLLKKVRIHSVFIFSISWKRKNSRNQDQSKKE